METSIIFEKRRDEAKDIETFIFEKPSGFEYKAGQYAHFDLSELTHPDVRGNSHHFTLSSSPTEDYISFTTKIRKESGYKQTFLELKVGDAVTIRKIKGMFTLENEATTTPQIFIAGGIGITPYRSIIRYIADKNLTVPVSLIYSASTSSELAFKRELDEIAQKHGNVTISYTVTEAEEDDQWIGLRGRIDEDMIRSLVPDLNAPVFWLCGPPAMVSAMEELLANLSVSQDRIKTERFTGY